MLKLFVFILLVIIPAHTAANEGSIDNTPAEESFTDLNLRLSNRPLTPPETIIVQTIPLTGHSVARPFVAPSPQAVIFENDQRQRLAILSMNETEHLTLYLLEPLPLDPKLPGLVQCANNRSCQTDRTPLTGGLGCLAFCLKSILEEASTSPSSR